MKPICMPCQRFFRPKKNGLYFIEAMPKENPALAGTAEPEKWTPYKLWCGDVWECAGCGARIISGTGRSEVAEHYQQDFQQKVQSLHAEFQVNDC